MKTHATWDRYMFEHTRLATEDEVATYAEMFNMQQFDLRVEITDVEFPEMWLIDKGVELG